MKTARLTGAVLLLFGAALSGLARDVVVLKGGVSIELKGPWVRRGNAALLTRADGTLLSVPVTEIDMKATAAAKASRGQRPDAVVVAAPPQNPAQAARLSRDGPKARVKISDADVRHVYDLSGEGEKKESETVSGGPRLEIADYSQEKAGGNLIVHGVLRNPGGAPAINARLSVSALDEKGEKIGSGEASLSNGLVEPGATISFSATVPIGEKFPASIRFAPQWVSTSPVSPGAARAPGAPAPQPAAPRPTPPPPSPTPYGRGNLYSDPPPSASTTPPADDHRGYLPEPSRPEDQPKKPN